MLSYPPSSTAWQKATGALGEHLVRKTVGAGVGVVAVWLPVEDDGVGDAIILQHVHAVLGLLHGLSLVDGLGEEVHADLDAVGLGVLDVLAEVGVQDDLAVP